MNKKPYSSAIKKTPFKYSISKKIARMLLDGFDRLEVFDKCYNKNEIEIISEDRRREVTNVVYERLSVLDSFLLKQFYDGDLVTSKYILTYAIAKTDSLFFEFLYEVYREALLGNKDYISIDDFENFFAAKKEIDPIIAKWSECTINDLSGGYRNILVESGLGTRIKKNIHAEKVIIHPAVEEHIALIGDVEFNKAMLGAK